VAGFLAPAWSFDAAEHCGRSEPIGALCVAVIWGPPGMKTQDSPGLLQSQHHLDACSFMELPKARSPASPATSTPKACLGSWLMASGGDNAPGRHLLAHHKGSSSTSFPQPPPQGSWLSPSTSVLAQSPRFLSSLGAPLLLAEELPFLHPSFHIRATIIHLLASPPSFTPSFNCTSTQMACYKL